MYFAAGRIEPPPLAVGGVGPPLTQCFSGTHVTTTPKRRRFVQPFCADRPRDRLTDAHATGTTDRISPHLMHSMRSDATRLHA